MKIIKGILSAIFAVVMLILAINTFESRVGGSEEYMNYGGDAYTGIQNAAAQTANNVQETNEILAYGFGSVLLGASFGFFLLSVCFFANGKSGGQMLSVDVDTSLKDKKTVLAKEKSVVVPVAQPVMAPSKPKKPSGDPAKFIGQKWCSGCGAVLPEVVTACSECGSKYLSVITEANVMNVLINLEEQDEERSSKEQYRPKAPDSVPVCKCGAIPERVGNQYICPVCCRRFS